MFLMGSWLVTVQIRYLHEVDAETQGYPLVSPEFYAPLRPSFSKFMFFRDAFHSCLHALHTPRSFTFSKITGMLVCFGSRFHVRASKNLQSLPHDYFFHVVSFISGKVVRSFSKFPFQPLQVLYFLALAIPHETRRFCYFSLVNADPSTRLHRERTIIMGAVTSMLMLDYRISVTSHFPRGNECCYGRYLWFPAGKVRFRTNPKIASEGFLGISFLIGWSVFRVRRPVGVIYRHAFRKPKFLARRCAVESRSQTKSGIPSVNSGDLAGRGYTGPLPISVDKAF